MERATDGVLSTLVTLLGGTREKGEVFFSLTFFLQHSDFRSRPWGLGTAPSAPPRGEELQFGVFAVHPGQLHSSEEQDTDTIALSLLLLPALLPELPPPQSSLTTRSAVPPLAMYLYDEESPAW